MSILAPKFAPSCGELDREIRNHHNFIQIAPAYEKMLEGTSRPGLQESRVQNIFFFWAALYPQDALTYLVQQWAH
jgi:hypothetical protein